MAYTTTPKEDPARRNKHTVFNLTRRTDGELIGPDLPKDKAWHRETREWWDMWRRSPIAPLLEESDWMALKRTAILHSDFWFGTLPPTQQVSYSAEIRRVESMYGATVEDRLKLRMRIINDSDAAKAEAEGTPVISGVNYSAMFDDDGDDNDS